MPLKPTKYVPIRIVYLDVSTKVLQATTMHRLCVWAVLCGVVVLNNVGKLKILHVKGFKFRLSHNNNMICVFFYIYLIFLTSAYALIAIYCL